jgi:hypothetical protein
VGVHARRPHSPVRRRLSQVQLPESDVTGMATVGLDIWIATSAGKLVVVRR